MQVPGLVGCQAKAAKVADVNYNAAVVPLIKVCS